MLETAWKVFQILGPIVAGGLAGGFMQRRRERITWEESAKGHLAKLRHEALAKCLGGLGQLYEMSTFGWTIGSYDDSDQDERRRKVAEPLRIVAEHEFMLPPDLRREMRKVLRGVVGDSPHNFHDEPADALCAAVDAYLPAIEKRS